MENLEIFFFFCFCRGKISKGGQKPPKLSSALAETFWSDFLRKKKNFLQKWPKIDLKMLVLVMRYINNLINLKKSKVATLPFFQFFGRFSARITHILKDMRNARARPRDSRAREEKKKNFL